MPERRATASNTVWACTECKRRKGKCSGDSPCAFCTKANRTCIYEARPVRLPLTRKNLDALQSRCAKLENLLRTLDPTIDIDALLNSGFTSPAPGTAPSHASSDSDADDHPDDDTFPDSAHGFEWHEPSDSDITVLSDGMANLNVDSRDVGYLGTSSGAALLRTVHRLISRHHPSPLLTPLTPHQPLTRLTTSLNSSIVTSTLLDAFFTHYHPSYPIIHEPLFRLKCADLSMIPASSPWRLIYYMALTLGAWTSFTGASGEDPELDLRIWLLARGGLSTTSILESGTLEGVQTLALMGQYLQKRDRPNTGYNMIGTAVRMALGLGLHREVGGGRETLAREMRRRTWWVLYIFDVGAAITFGRPTAVPERAETRLPCNVDDSSLTNPTSPLPPPTTSLAPYTSLIAHSTLCRLAHQVHASHTLSRNLTHTFLTNLHTWRVSLPHTFTAVGQPQTVVLLRDLNLRILLTKRFLPRLRQGDKDASVCVGAAMETVDMVSKWEVRGRGEAWYGTYFVFQAALVLVIAGLEMGGGWEDGVRGAEGCLRAALECLGEGAQRCLDVLARVGGVGTRGGGGGEWGMGLEGEWREGLEGLVEGRAELGLGLEEWMMEGGYGNLLVDPGPFGEGMGMGV